MAPPKMLAFDKYQGLGNDFIVVDAEFESELSVEQARKLCDRRFGIGGDGVLVVLPATRPDHVARMKVINADGSVPEMCGNGLRCVALHVARREARVVGVASDAYETGAGTRSCQVALNEDHRSATVTVDMGRSRVDGEHAVELPGEAGPFGRMSFTLVDMGNPHAVYFEPASEDDIRRVGLRIATHESFPAGVNVGFAKRIHAREYDLVVWERGVGRTLACGTGACALVAAACSRGFAPYGEWVAVHLPGGDLELVVDRESGGVTMRGPARHVFAGRLPVT